MQSTSTKAWYPLFLVIIALVAYCNTPWGPYCYDDTTMIRDVRALETWDGFPKLFSREYGPTFRDLRYRPVSQITYFLDAMIFHKSSFASRCINIFLHTLIGLSLFVFWKSIFRHLGEKAPPLTFAASAIFLCHPITTEVVNSPGFRREQLSLLCILWSILFLQRGFEKQAFRYISLAGFIWLVGLFSKEPTFMVAAFAPMLFFFVNLKKNQESPSAVLRQMFRPTIFRGAMVLLFAAAFACYAYAYYHLSYDLSGEAAQYRQTAAIPGQDVPDTTGKLSPWPGGGGRTLGILNFARTTGTYAQLWAIPFGFSINHYFESSRTFGDYRLWLSLLGLTAFGLCSLILYWRGSPLGVGGLWVCIAFLPIAEIIPVPEILVERYVYHAHVGASLLIACLLLRWNPFLEEYVPGKRSTTSKFIQHHLFYLALLLYIPLTLWRNQDWMDEVGLNIAAYKQWNNVEGNFRVGALYVQAGKPQEAIPYFERVAREDSGEKGTRSKEILQKIAALPRP